MSLAWAPSRKKYVMLLQRRAPQILRNGGLGEWFRGQNWIRETEFLHRQLQCNSDNWHHWQGQIGIERVAHMESNKNFIIIWETVLTPNLHCACVHLFRYSASAKNLPSPMAFYQRFKEHMYLPQESARFVGSPIFFISASQTSFSVDWGERSFTSRYLLNFVHKIPWLQAFPSSEDDPDLYLPQFLSKCNELRTP